MNLDALPDLHRYNGVVFFPCITAVMSACAIARRNKMPTSSASSKPSHAYYSRGQDQSSS
jgi:hypothetical protein